MTLAQVAALVGGQITGGGDEEIGRVARIEDAGPGDITFLADPRYRRYLTGTRATAILVDPAAGPEELAGRPAGLHLVRVSDPYGAFLRLAGLFHPPETPLPRGVHPSAVIGRDCRIGPGAAIGANAVIGDRCRIGDGVAIHACCVLSDDVEVGAGSILYPLVAVRERCRIGERAVIHPGAVIGSDGFGFAPQDDGSYRKIPQRGIVVVEDDVEIGANCAIDRATVGETRICRGVKLDNLIHLAHNVVVGESTVIAAQTGVSGSTRIGKQCRIAGQVGFTGHIRIADQTTIGAQSGVSKDIPAPGKTYFGYPARELRETLRIEGSLRQLPDLLREVRLMQERLGQLELLVSGLPAKQTGS